MVVADAEDCFSCVVVADAEVVELACSAEGEFAESVDDVVSDPVVGGEGCAVGGGFDGGRVGLCGGLASERAVGSLLESPRVVWRV